MKHLTIYSTEGCHLCEEAKAMLIQIAKSDIERFEWRMIDIIDDPQMYARYHLVIPVVRDLSSGNELGWPFSVADLQEFLAK